MMFLICCSFSSFLSCVIKLLEISTLNDENLYWYMVINFVVHCGLIMFCSVKLIHMLHMWARSMWLKIAGICFILKRVQILSHSVTQRSDNKHKGFWIISLCSLSSKNVTFKMLAGIVVSRWPFMKLVRATFPAWAWKNKRSLAWSSWFSPDYFYPYQHSSQFMSCPSNVSCINCTTYLALM